MWAPATTPPGIFALAQAWWEQPTTMWLGLGLALILAELVIPQLFVMFLGFGALAVSVGFYLGWVSSPEVAVGVWVAASAALLWALRDILMRMAPGDTETENIDEDLVAAGSYVEVVWSNPEDPHVGRVQFRGTQWDAWCPDSPLQEGTRVRLIARENLRWLVERDTALTPPTESQN